MLSQAIWRSGIAQVEWLWPLWMGLVDKPLKVGGETGETKEVTS